MLLGFPFDQRQLVQGVRNLATKSFLFVMKDLVGIHLLHFLLDFLLNSF